MFVSCVYVVCIYMYPPHTHTLSLFLCVFVCTWADVHGSQTLKVRYLPRLFPHYLLRQGVTEPGSCWFCLVWLASLSWGFHFCLPSAGIMGGLCRAKPTSPWFLDMQTLVVMLDQQPPLQQWSIFFFVRPILIDGLSHGLNHAVHLYTVVVWRH